MPKPLPPTTQPATPPPRRIEPRCHVNWSDCNYLRIAKALAVAVFKNERLGETDLWRRVDELLPKFVFVLLGTWRNMDLRALNEHIVELDQGLTITPSRLYARANKDEPTDFTDRVERLYLVLTDRLPPVPPPPRRLGA